MSPRKAAGTAPGQGGDEAVAADFPSAATALGPAGVVPPLETGAVATGRAMAARSRGRWRPWAVALVVALVVDAALWLWTFRVLTNRDVGWRAHLPGAVLGAVGLEVLKVVGGIYVPMAVTSSSVLYGPLGVVFAILAWLLVFGRLVVYTAVFNVVRWENRHGTVTAEIELPRMLDEVPVGTTRAGEAQPQEPT